ncbi:Rha family transcriptional regulator [Bacillus cereus]|nr:Rha family transcriptional regulator [Bacillus cereus]MEB8668793.1 Rha family transcriptional regulator [Bacillus cereus]MEC3020915.1 Rha family transcriptional regulator [Bacillus cereus]MEC3260301.1 Rha family transcriptional regulator [Bacillus cereus]HDR7453459.1 Rha family transcriptional regulator [Bacillus cereus]
MNQLQVINVEGNLLVDSLEVAEMIGKRHSDLIRSIENYVSVLENAKMRSQDFFEETLYKAEGNNKNYKKYFITKKGCDMVANKLTGDKGILFTANYVNQFEKMERYIKDQEQGKPKTALDQLQQLLLEGTVELKERVEVIEHKIETKMTIDYQQQRIMQNTVEATVRHLWNNGTSHGRFTKRQLFSKAHRRLKDRYGVASYKDILEKDFEEAIDYMRNWKGE